MNSPMGDASAISCGIFSVNVLPAPGELFAVIAPPMISAMFFVIGSPSPTPSPTAPILSKLLNISGSFWGGMPQPLSAI